MSDLCLRRHVRVIAFNIQIFLSLVNVSFLEHVQDDDVTDDRRLQT